MATNEPTNTVQPEGSQRPSIETEQARASSSNKSFTVPGGYLKGTSPPPPGLKLKGGSLPGAAAEYMGFYMLDGNKRVNGRPAWKHTNGSCWIAFDGGIWRGQPEADLGRKSGPLLILDAAAATPDASSATWKAWTGSAWAAQPALKCTVATAAELSAAQAAPKRRAEEERRAKEERRAEDKRRAAREAPVKNFRGPCADCCKPLAPCCCVSADGEAIFGCVPTEPKYFFLACLHMALCPQLGCDPRGGDEEMDYCCTPFIFTLLFTPFVFCVQSESSW